MTAATSSNYYKVQKYELCTRVYSAIFLNSPKYGLCGRWMQEEAQLLSKWIQPMKFEKKKANKQKPTQPSPPQAGRWKSWQSVVQKGFSEIYCDYSSFSALLTCLQPALLCTVRAETCPIQTHVCTCLWQVSMSDIHALDVHLEMFQGTLIFKCSALQKITQTHTSSK